MACVYHEYIPSSLPFPPLPLNNKKSNLAAGLLRDSYHYRLGDMDHTNTADNTNLQRRFDDDLGAGFLGAFSEQAAAAAEAATTPVHASASPLGTSLLGLDLAFNDIGPIGTAALNRALTSAPGIAFLEIRGNERLGPEHPLVSEVESTCADRRRRLSFLQLERSHPRQSREEEHRRTPSNNLHSVRRTRGEERGVAGGGSRSALGSSGTRISLSVTQPRPLEGRLPMRGCYISPLLDSCFDLLMLREPVPDPDDHIFYVNQTRAKLAQRTGVQRKTATASSEGKKVAAPQRGGLAGGERKGGGGGGHYALSPFPKGVLGERAWQLRLPLNCPFPMLREEHASR